MPAPFAGVGTNNQKLMTQGEKIGAYYRTSTSTQEKKDSIKTQMFLVREAYRKQGRVIAKEYSDNGYSGNDLDRPAIRGLLDDCENGRINVVAVYDMNRLSRNEFDEPALRYKFRKWGVRVEVLGNELKDNSPTEQFINSIFNSVAALERKITAKRTSDGILRKIKEGQYMASVAPYGYKRVKYDNKTVLEIEPKEAEVVKKIFEIYAIEKSLGKTAQRLFEEGYRSRSGKTFSPFMLGNLLGSETYIGKCYFKTRTKAEPKNPRKANRRKKASSYVWRPRSEWLGIDVPAIIDNLTFRAVQEIRKDKALQSEKPTRNYLCQGLIRCTKCGFLYIGKMKSKSHREEAPNGNHFSYICPCRSSKRRPGTDYCHSREIATNKIDTLVWDYVHSLATRPERVRQMVLEHLKAKYKDRAFNEGFLKSLLADEKKLETEKQRYLTLFGKEFIDEATLKVRMREIKENEEKIQANIVKVETELEMVRSAEQIEKQIDAYCEEVTSFIGESDFDRKKRIIRQWVKEITLPEGGGIKIDTFIPLKDGRKFVLFPDNREAVPVGVVKHCAPESH